MYYPINESTKELMKKKLEVAIYNNQRENEILHFISGVLPEYKGQYNKRLTTFLDKKLAERFGIWRYESDYPETNPSHDVNNVNTTISNNYSSPQFNIYYNGKEIYNGYNANNDIKDRSNLKLYFYSVDSVKELQMQLQSGIEQHNNYAIAFKRDKKALNSLIASHNKVAKLVSDHNDKFSYVLSDELRIK